MEKQDWSKQTRANTKTLAYWTAAWVVSMAIASFGPKFIWNENSTITFIAIFFNAAMGLGMILANIRHFKGLDELQRKIHLDAMGIALGVGVVGGLSYSLLETSGLISQHAEISFLVILISLTYLGGIIYGQKSYK